MQETPQDKRRVGEDFSGAVVVLLDEQVPPGIDDTLLVHARRSGLDQLVELLLALGNPPTERQVTSVRVEELVEAERARLGGPFPPLRSRTRYWWVDVVDGGVRVEEAVARLRDVRGVAGSITDPLFLAAAGTVVRSGDVVLLEVQRAGLPTETQLADFDAIRFVAGVASPDPGIGAVVVEAAGNGDDTDGVDLDVPQGAPAAGTQWWAGRTADSGAILVGPVGRRRSTEGMSAGASPISAPVCTATPGVTAWSPPRPRDT